MEIRTFLTGAQKLHASGFGETSDFDCLIIFAILKTNQDANKLLSFNCNTSFFNEHSYISNWCIEVRGLWVRSNIWFRWSYHACNFETNQDANKLLSFNSNTSFFNGHLDTLNWCTEVRGLWVRSNISFRLSYHACNFETDQDVNKLLSFNSNTSFV